MTENTIIILLILIYLFVSYKIHTFLLKVKTGAFILLSITYFLFTFFLFEGSVFFNSYIRNFGIYLDFGHADELLVEMFLMFIIVALTNIIIVVERRKRRESNK